MNGRTLINKIMMGLWLACTMTLVHAAAPLWTFVPDPGSPPSVTITSTETKTIKYTVTNNSRKTHQLQMTPIQGIASSGCDMPLSPQGSCTLVLQVTGAALSGDVLGGPVLCEKGSALQCYGPSQGNALAIRLNNSAPQYEVFPDAGLEGAINPSSMQTVGEGATINFVATPNPGYGVLEWLVGDLTVQEGGTTYQLNNITANQRVLVTFGPVKLRPSVETLALSINCLPASGCTNTQNAALTGNSRTITMTNTRAQNATNVLVTSIGLPSGTSISADTCSGATIAPGATCAITLTPGSTASADFNSIECTAGTAPIGWLKVTADGDVPIRINTYVLGYGCQYQGGFLYSVDDTTALTGSIGGKVVSLTDQAPRFPNGIIWSSNGIGSQSAQVNYRSILGIDNTSTLITPSPIAPAYPSGTPAYSACNGKSDGACNSSNIISYYNANRVSVGVAPTPLTFYAAGLCKAVINSYSDWYLPAICEMGPAFGSSGCAAGAQNIVSDFPALIGNPASPNPGTSCTLGANCLVGHYWSSTELSFTPQDYAWGEYFASGGGSFQNRFNKFAQLGVRCSRALTL